MSFWNYVQSNYHTILTDMFIHFKISALSIFFAAVIAIPLGIVLTKHRRAAVVVTAIAGVIQTIPSLVLIGIALMLFGMGAVPAIVVLTAYGILPIMENTYVGITEIEHKYVEAARGIGMSDMQILFKVQIPIAIPTIIAGIRLSTIYIISWTTLAALIGAGGLGDLIWTGLACADTNMILSGAIPASLMAILSGFLFDWIQKGLVNRRHQKGGEN